MKEKKGVGVRLEELRKQLNMTQQEFAKELNIPQRTYSNYENETNKIPPEILQLISSKFHVNLHWLLTGEGEMYLKPWKLGETKLGEGYLQGESQKSLPPLTIEETRLLEEIKKDEELLYILRELKDSKITKSIIYTLLKAKGMDEASIDKYLKILKSALS
ncbi:MAG: helix-turn-helix transcriptional regulator [Brevinematales bacterium]|nr:helix-turn-helix transcriptional regulator [Brevinematales bacterium]